MKKKVIFTIDVEGHVGDDPVKHLIYGITNNGQRAGIDMIMDLLDEHQIKGVFFVDIAEAWDYGEDIIAEVLLHIKERGHDVGVHIHPDHMLDKNRLFLSEYTFDEQYEIIKKCTDFYQKVLHEKPLSFRAGKYGANKDTLAIISQLGYRLDFSQFYGQKWCHINPPVTKVSVNKITKDLVEIPVTIYNSFSSFFYSRNDKIDATTTFLEFKKIVNQMLKNDSYDVIVLFAHSFSFLEWRKNPNTPIYSSKLYKRLEAQLDFVRNNKLIQVLTLDELINTYFENKSVNSQRIEKLSGFYSWYSFFEKCIKVFKTRVDLKLRKD